MLKYFFLLFSVLVFSQSTKIDSLSNLINSSTSNKEKISLLIKRSKSYKPVEVDLPLKDAELAVQLAKKEDDAKLKVDALLQLAGINSRANNFGKALELSIQANDFAKKENYQLGELNATTGIGRNLMGLGKDKEAIVYIENAKKIAIENNNTKELKNIYNILGITYRKIGKFENSLEVFNQVIPLIDPKKENKLLALMYMNKANTLNELSRYNEAIDNHLKALSIFEENQDVKGIMQVNNNLVPLFIKVSQWEKAKKYAQRTKFYLKENENDLSRAQLYDNYGLILENLKQKDSVLFYRKKSLKLFSNLKDKYNVARLKHNIANYYLLEKNYNQAEKHFLVALTERNKLANKKDIAQTQILLTSTYLGLNKVDEAEKYFQLAKTIFDKVSLSQKETYLKVSKEFYAKTGNHEKALEESDKLLLLKDSLFQNNELVDLINKENKLELSKKNIQLNEIKEIKNRFNLNKIIYGILIFLVFLLALYSFVRWKKSDLKRKQISKEKELILTEHKETSAELEKVKQMVVEDHIVLKNKSKIYLNSLVYIKTEDHYLNFFTNNNKKEFLRGTIAEILKQLPPNFVKCHRSFIVNKNFIKSNNNKEIILIDETIIPITRGFKL
jgi:tetratricopeptide (TPR) repeat protein